jgi:hypothetical protein
VKTGVTALLVLAATFLISAGAAAGPRVTFRCAQDHSSKSPALKVRNDGPDRLNAGTVIYYFYRTPASDMSIVGSHVLESRLDKGGIFTISLGGRSATEITECGCSLRRIIPTARTTERKAP